jgi:hypothetical protein
MARPDHTGRERYRDDDDQRDRLSGDERSGTSPDPRSEARGSAREAVGNTARDTDASPTGPSENDNQRSREDAAESDDVPRSRR